MKRQKSFLIAFICLVFGFIATISLAQQAQDDFSVEDVGAGAKLVVTSVSGPATAIHNQTISVTYTVKNQGTVASGSYKVGLYLSTDKKIDPAADRLLEKCDVFHGIGTWGKQEDDCKGIGSDQWIVRELLLRCGCSKQQEGFIEAGFPRPLLIGGR